MTTYLSIRYDVLNSVINYLDAPTPDLANLLRGADLYNDDITDILQNIKFDSEIPLSQTVYEDILDFLNTVPELDLNDSKTVILRIEFEDDEITGNVDIVSKNLDGTKTYITKGGWPIIIIKPFKFPTLGKCRDCLKLTFGSDNDYNFTGNLGGDYLGSFRNGQKQYQFYLPDFSQAAVLAGTYGTAKPYIIFWKPSVTTSYVDQNGQTQTVTGNRWIAVPSASIGTAQELGPNTFFHRNTFINNNPVEQAACPYYKSNSPIVPPYFNFGGNTGNFLLETVNAQLNKPCPTFKPTTGSVIFGYNCNQEVGCIPASSGSVQFLTLAECEIGCPISTGSADTGSYGWACTNPYPGFSNCIYVTASYTGGTVYPTQQACLENCAPTYGYNCNEFTGQCVQGTFSNTGSFNTLIECQASGCGDLLDEPTTCSCDPATSVVNNNFPFGPSGFAYSPGTLGTWNFNQGYAQSITTTQFNTNSAGYVETSSMWLGGYEALNVSCSYSLCFQAWQTTNVPSSTIIFDGSAPFPNQPSTGTYPVPNAQIFQNLTSVPTAYTCNFVAGSPNFRFYLGVAAGAVGRINIDNVCISLIGCPPTASDCIISGSAYCYEDIEYDCLCPEGFTPDLNGNCIASGSITVPKIITGPSFPNIPATHPAWGHGRPNLYYSYGTDGISPTWPAGQSSPNFGNPSVYNTTRQFDILRHPWWSQPVDTTQSPVSSNYYNIPGYQNRFMNKNMIDLPLSNTFLGGGSFINVTASKTMYACIAGDDGFRLKLNGTTLASIGNLAQVTPFNSQHFQARFTTTNPYIQSSFYTVGNYTYTSYHLLPFTMPSGCNYVTLEGIDVDGVVSGFSGLILDNTATELINATSENDLNIVWNAKDDLLYDLNAGITASCPPGATEIGPEPCDLCLASGSSIPCGDCIECFNGILYNGLIVDAGGRSLLGRGFTPFPSNNTGIVNINPLDNPINTWYIPDEAAWDTLITYLNNNTAPSAVTGSLGSLGTVAGGKMKDYVRDLNASCWDFPNAGAQNNSNSSGWAGIGSGQRDDLGVYSGFGTDGYWWSANSVPTNIPNPPSNYNYLATRELKHWSFDVYKNIYPKSYGFSIRLVRPAVAGEIDGSTIFNAYKGNDGKLYDGIVIGTQVWITKNLAEQNQNNGGLVPGGVVQANVWSTLLSANLPAHNYYDNIFANTSSLDGNIDPVTGLCYEYPSYYIYQKCGGTETLIQEVSGSTTTPGTVQKAPDGTCWSFVEQINTNPTINASIYSTTNYFSGSNYVYDDCDECNAIHTIYTRFNTKNC